MTVKTFDESLQDAAVILTKIFPGLGFALTVFQFNTDKGAAGYISNAEKEDMIRALRMTADRLEQNLTIDSCIG